MMQDLRDKIVEAVNSLKEKELNNIAIITKNLALFKGNMGPYKYPSFFKVYRKENLHIAEGVMVMPSYYAKGLEFDGAIVIEESMEEDYKDNLMYIMCTRALHNLEVIKRR